MFNSSFNSNLKPIINLTGGKKTSTVNYEYFTLTDETGTALTDEANNPLQSKNEV
jgi:hypothetical protein